MRAVERLDAQAVAVQPHHRRAARHLGGQRHVGGAVDAGDGQQLGFHRGGEDARLGVALGAGERAAAQRRVDMDVAVGDDLGAVAHQRQHHQVAVARVDLLARAQRPVDDHRRRRGQLHLDDALGHHRRVPARARARAARLRAPRPGRRRRPRPSARRCRRAPPPAPCGGGAAARSARRSRAARPASRTRDRSIATGSSSNRPGITLARCSSSAASTSRSVVFSTTAISVSAALLSSRTAVAISLETTAMQCGTRKRAILSARPVSQAHESCDRELAHLREPAVDTIANAAHATLTRTAFNLGLDRSGQWPACQSLRATCADQPPR